VGCRKDCNRGDGGSKKILDFGFWILDFGFWVNFRLEDRICRKEVKKNLKLETGKVKGGGPPSRFAAPA